MVYLYGICIPYYYIQYQSPWDLRVLKHVNLFSYVYLFVLVCPTVAVYFETHHDVTISSHVFWVQYDHNVLLTDVEDVQGERMENQEVDETHA